MNTKKLAVGGVVLAVLIALFSLGSKSKPTGGTFNPVTTDFSQGITLNGTPYISSTGVMGSTTGGIYAYKPVITYTTDTTLTASQTGAIINMGTAGLDLTLPTPASATGVHYRFVVSSAFATTDMTIVAGTTDTIDGSLIVAGAVVACDAADIITIAAANEDVGDFIDLYSNGTNWLIGANQAMTASNHACSG